LDYYHKGKNKLKGSGTRQIVVTREFQKGRGGKLRVPFRVVVLLYGEKGTRVKKNQNLWGEKASRGRKGEALIPPILNEKGRGVLFLVKGGLEGKKKGVSQELRQRFHLESRNFGGKRPSVKKGGGGGGMCPLRKNSKYPW